MLLLVTVILLLISVGLVAYVIGALKLAKFGFRVSTGTGLLVLLCPPYTFFFAMFKLEEAGKELPTALCMFGLVTALVLGGLFNEPLQLAATGQLAVAEAAANAKPPEYVPPAPVEKPAVEEAPKLEEQPVGEEAAPGEGEEAAPAAGEEAAPAEGAAQE
ncbi:MAG: hypothetical protein H0U74_17900 [Bradymonadaceae bacterium]|nr:hypothetical protein [Lujinxingiaceae bacterium]